MRRNHILVLMGVCFLCMACKKEESGIIYPPQAEGRFTFLQSEMNISVTSSTSSIAIPVRLTRRDYTQSLTANISISGEETTAVIGSQIQLFSVTNKDAMDGYYAVAELAPGDSTTLFPMLLLPEQITTPVTVQLFIPDTYYSPHMDEVINHLTVHLNPVE